MKKILIIFLLLISAFTYSQTVYYCSPTGDDDDPGTFAEPFATWEKLGSVLTAGDTGYVRGGTYTTAAVEIYQCLWQNLTGTSSDTIKIWNYPGETPVWDLIGMPDLDGEGIFQCAAIEIDNCDYLWVKGLTIRRYLQQNIGIPGARHFPIGINIVNSSYNVIENCTVDSIGGAGFSVGYDGYNQLINNTDSCWYTLFLNCDAISANDPYSDSQYENAQGFQIMHNGDDTPDSNPWAPETTFRGCRTWFNSDDGWDLYGSDGYPIYIENCWSFWNGYRDTLFNTYSGGPVSNGFKTGPNYLDLQTVHTGTLVNCLAVMNTGYGILQNDHEYGNGEGWSLWHYYNNLIYKNNLPQTGGIYGIMAGYWSHLAYVFRNNISYKNVDTTSSSITYQVAGYTDGWDNSVYNSWNENADGWNASFTITNADFESLDIYQLNDARQANGDLPDITFGHLAVGSDLIEGGVGVGYPYDNDAPDLGPYWDYVGGGENPPPANAPSITTTTPTIIYTRLVRAGGSSIDAGGGTITAKGVCYSTSVNPTVSDSKVSGGTGTDAFSGYIPNLKANTTYHVRAYATNATATSYGADIEFTTPVHSTGKTGGKYLKYQNKILIIH